MQTKGSQRIRPIMAIKVFAYSRFGLRRLYLPVLVLLLTFGIMADGCKEHKDKRNATGPKLLLPSGKLVHLGKVRAHGFIEGTVEIQNIGTEPLEIANVSTSCSCMTAKLQNSMIEAGQTGVISVHYSASGKPGLEAQSLVIQSNDQTQRAKKVQVTVEIVPEWGISKKHVNFGVQTWGQKSEVKTIWLMHIPIKPDEEVAVPTIAEYDNKLLNVNIIPWGTDRPQFDGSGQRFQITIGLNSKAPLGYFERPLCVEWESKRGRRQEIINVSGRVQGSFECIPESLIINREFVRAGDILGEVVVKNTGRFGGDHVPDNFVLSEKSGCLKAQIIRPSPKHHSNDTNKDILRLQVRAARDITRGSFNLIIRKSSGEYLELPIVVITRSSTVTPRMGNA